MIEALESGRETFLTERHGEKFEENKKSNTGFFFSTQCRWGEFVVNKLI